MKTPLDLYHGVDFFIDFCDQNGIALVLSGDVSLKYNEPDDESSEHHIEMHEDKIESTNAFLKVPQIPDPNTDIDGYLDLVKKVASDVVAEYIDKIRPVLKEVKD